MNKSAIESVISATVSATEGVTIGSVKPLSSKRFTTVRRHEVWSGLNTREGFESAPERIQRCYANHLTEKAEWLDGMAEDGNVWAEIELEKLYNSIEFMDELF